MEAIGESNKSRTENESDDISEHEERFPEVNSQESFNSNHSCSDEETKLLNEAFNLGGAHILRIWNEVKDNIDFSDVKLITESLRITNRILKSNIIDEWNKDTFLSVILHTFQSQESNIPEAKLTVIWKKIKNLAVSNPEAKEILKDMSQLAAKYVKPYCVQSFYIKEMKTENPSERIEKTTNNEMIIKNIYLSGTNDPSVHSSEKNKSSTDTSNVQYSPRLSTEINNKDSGIEKSDQNQEVHLLLINEDLSESDNNKDISESTDILETKELNQKEEKKIHSNLNSNNIFPSIANEDNSEATSEFGIAPIPEESTSTQKEIVQLPIQDNVASKTTEINLESSGIEINNAEPDISIKTEELKKIKNENTEIAISEDKYTNLDLTSFPQYRKTVQNQPITSVEEENTLNNQDNTAVSQKQLVQLSEDFPSYNKGTKLSDEINIPAIIATLCKTYESQTSVEIEPHIEQFPEVDSPGYSYDIPSTDLISLPQYRKTVQNQPIQRTLDNQDNTVVLPKNEEPKQPIQVSHDDLDIPSVNNGTKLSSEINIPAIIAKLCKTHESQTTEEIQPHIEVIQSPVDDTPMHTPSAEYYNHAMKEEFSPFNSVFDPTSIPTDFTSHENPHTFIRTIDIILKIMEGTLAGAYRISQNCTGPIIPLSVANTMNSVRLSLESLRTHFSYHRQDTFEPITSIIRQLLTPAVELFQTICPELEIPDVDFYPPVLVQAPEPEIPRAPLQITRPEYIVTSRNVWGTTVFDNYPLPPPAQPPRLPLYRMGLQDPCLGIYCTAEGFIRIQLPSTYLIEISIDKAICVKNTRDKTSVFISACGNFSGIETNLCRVNQRGKVCEVKITDNYSNKILFGKIGVRGVQFGGWADFKTAHLKEDGEIASSGYNVPDLESNFIQDLFIKHSINGPDKYDICCAALQELETNTLCDGSLHIYWRDINIKQYPNGDITVSRNHWEFFIWLAPEFINPTDNVVRKGIVRLATPLTRVATTIISTSLNIHERFVLLTQEHQWLYYNANEFLASNEVYSAGYKEETAEQEEDLDEAAGYYR